jgi:hypothetical protein
MSYNQSGTEGKNLERQEYDPQIENKCTGIEYFPKEALPFNQFQKKTSLDYKSKEIYEKNQNPDFIHNYEEEVHLTEKAIRNMNEIGDTIDILHFC